MMRPPLATPDPDQPDDDAGRVLLPVLRRLDLLALGWTDQEIRRQVKAGALARVRRGAFVDGPSWSALDERVQHAHRARAVLLQASTELVVSHGSALPEWDAPTWGIDLTEVQVTRTDHRAGRREAGVRQHRGVLQPEDVVERNGIKVTAATRTLLDISTVTSTEKALPVWDDMLHRGLTSIDELVKRYSAKHSDHPMAHWPHTLNTDLLMRIADGRRESVGESRTWFTCWQHQLPLPVPQFEIHDERGKVLWRLDFAWPDLGVWLEFDGRQKYTQFLRDGEDVTDAVLREKRRESDIARITGWRCIRVTWKDLANPARLAATIAAELAKGPQRSPAVG